MKKLIGVYDNTGVMIQKRPISVFPVYTDGKNFFLKCMSENLNNLLKVLRGLSDHKEIEEEIDAYINKENSLYSEKLLRYNDDSNYCYYLCTSEITSMPGFQKVESFPIVKEETKKETYSTDTYAIIDYQNNLIVGSLEFVNKYVPSVMNLNMNQLLKQEELIKKINSLLEINRLFI